MSYEDHTFRTPEHGSHHFSCGPLHFELFGDGRGWMFPSHGVANLTQQWLQRYGWEILPHPAHSPDLALSDFHLFGPLKRHLGGMAFETEDDLISELRNWFDNLDVDFFRVGINSLLWRWQKCIDLHGDYVEK
ncbi:histone-lysine N-methyltransferase SETMAR [Plakobranchus ocellatus]|uniref:Histone-lysine N-methyltransferase SETMAR n=1 Tax=Plakobranchus ocellatus TaxID=259542 RepID=A0AAV3Z1G0_9GAST|nr:histone-lysine N-methyltransferase SETMAR [Plakobranchus ocellatus]